MRLEVCNNCGGLFYNMSETKICFECQKKLDVQLKGINDYIQQHSKADIKEVSEECDVRCRQIEEFVREGKLKLSEDSPIGVSCIRCGRTVHYGRYCAKCQEKIDTAISNLRWVYKKENIL